MPVEATERPSLTQSRSILLLLSLTQQWERASSSLHTVHQITTAGVEEVMVSKPYGITVRSLLSFSAPSHCAILSTISTPFRDSLSY